MYDDDDADGIDPNDIGYLSLRHIIEKARAENEKIPHNNLISKKTPSKPT